MNSQEGKLVIFTLGNDIDSIIYINYILIIT